MYRGIKVILPLRSFWNQKKRPTVLKGRETLAVPPLLNAEITASHFFDLL
jgi:hypothetical protein